MLGNVTLCDVVLEDVCLSSPDIKRASSQEHWQKFYILTCLLAHICPLSKVNLL